MPPSSKTVTVQEEESLVRKRVTASTDKTSSTQDSNNNQISKDYPIDDINYLRSETEKSPNQREEAQEEAKPDYSDWKAEIRWPDTIVQTFLHSGALYGIYLLFYVRFYTLIWLFTLVVFSGFGITAGVHRLWSHNSYKAKWQLRVILMFLFSIAGQRDAYTWAHDHRIHHKYSESDADPHNCHRGFFFAHIGWVVLTPHPLVVAKRKTIDMSDLEADPIVMFQKKYFEIFFALFSIAMPVLTPWYFWNESLWLSFWVMFNLRFCTTLNIAFFVNSVAHMYGDRPYDKNLTSVESLPVAIAALGEGWHNYHHVFPWDYKTSELGKFNISTGFIDFFARLGWAVDRKSVSASMIRRRAERCGDGTHFLSDAFSHKDAVWGYGDKDISRDDQRELQWMND